MEKAKVLDVFFTSVFTGQFDLRLPTTKNPTALRLEGKSGAQKVYYWWVRPRLANLNKMNICKFMGLMGYTLLY